MKTTAILSSLVITNAIAFAPSNNGMKMKTQLQATNKNSFDPFTLSENEMKINSSIPKMAAATAAALALNPVVAMAEELADDYEYGAVSAPIGLAWGVGLLAVLTALLPLALQGGEEAFEEMRGQEEGTWGGKNSDRLNKRK